MDPNQTFLADRGQNLFTTSTHTGHHWRPGYYFPSSNFKPVIMEPIPKALNLKDQVLPEVHFQTTKETYHDNKFPNQDLYNDPLSLRQTKALPSYKVNYLADTVEKLNSKPRRPLTMAFQKSEYKEGFDDLDMSELRYVYDRPIHPTNYLDHDEKHNQYTKIAFDGNVKPNVPVKPIDPSQTGVLNLLDPYMTTYNKEHHKFTKDQLKNIGKKDAITIHSDDVPTSKVSVNGPMRDQIWFKSETKLRRVHEPAKMVPNSGMIPETREKFVPPSDVKGKEAKICPIDTPYILPEHSMKTAFADNRMYNTEYTEIGKGRFHAY